MLSLIHNSGHAVVQEWTPSTILPPFMHMCTSVPPWLSHENSEKALYAGIPKFHHMNGSGTMYENHRKITIQTLFSFSRLTGLKMDFFLEAIIMKISTKLPLDSVWFLGVAFTLYERLHETHKLSGKEISWKWKQVLSEYRPSHTKIYYLFYDFHSSITS